MSDNWLVCCALQLLFFGFRALWNIKEMIINPDKSKGARIYDIVYRHNMDKVLMPSSLDFFCLRFKKTVPLSTVLGENVYLYCFDRAEVAFIVVEPGKEIWRSKYGAFYRQAQNDHAEQIIRISLEDFFAVCKDLPNPGSKINFIHFVPRSGSTLLLQMFEATGQCITASEPGDFIPEPIKLKPGITRQGKVELFTSIGKYVSRGVSDSNSKYKWYFAKLNASFSLQYYDVVKESFPESKHVFLHREMKSTLKSSIHSFNHFKSLHAVEGMVDFVPFAAWYWRKYFLDIYTYTGWLSRTTVDKMKSLWYKHRPNNGMILYGFCGTYAFYLNKQNLPAIKYDDLVENRTENTRRILQHFELPVDLVNKAVKAMDKDSQQNSKVSKKKIGTKDSVSLDDGMLELADDFCKLFNIPGLNEDQRHPNTITVPTS